MSFSTPVLIECRLPDGAPGGLFTTFDAGLLLDELRLDAHGSVWQRVPAMEDEPAGAWEPTPLDGLFCVREDDGARREYAVLLAGGKVQAIRPGWREAWQSPVASPGGPAQRLLVFANLPGDSGRLHDEAVWMEAAGLPEPAAPGCSWVIATSGHLVACTEPQPDRAGWEQSIRLAPAPFHGWVFLTDPEGRLPVQAMRFVSGRRQWVVPVDRDGTAAAPRTMAGLGFPSRNDGQRHQALLAASPVLPTDYSDYGGDTVRWERDSDSDPDCSTGCRWFASLHDAKTGCSDGDWGVCTNPRSPRLGLLTWEHQAGRECWEGEDEAGR